jgi:hypothetical protein
MKLGSFEMLTLSVTTHDQSLGNWYTFLRCHFPLRASDLLSEGLWTSWCSTDQEAYAREEVD